MTARKVTRQEGLLVGGSCGTAVWAALEVGKELGPEHLVVVILPDSGKSYLSKLYNESWMAEYGFIERPAQPARIGDLISEKRRIEPGIPDLVAILSSEKVGRAIDILQEFGISQLPVATTASPKTTGELIGSINERSLLDRVFRDRDAIEGEVSGVMDLPLPVVQTAAGIEEMFSDLSKGAEAVVVAEGDRPVGVLTRADLLEFMAHQATS